MNAREKARVKNMSSDEIFKKIDVNADHPAKALEYFLILNAENRIEFIKYSISNDSLPKLVLVHLLNNFYIGD